MEVGASERVRHDAWETMSDLYLDQDVARMLPAIAERLAASPFTLDELRRMLRHEVHPALCFNLANVAGEWTGFDREWLIARIERHRRKSRWLRVLDGFMSRHADDGWRQLQPLIEQSRRALSTKKTSSDE